MYFVSAGGDGRRSRTHARGCPGVPLERTVDVRVRLYSLEPVEK